MGPSQIKLETQRNCGKKWKNKVEQLTNQTNENWGNGSDQVMIDNPRSVIDWHLMIQACTVNSLVSGHPRD